MARRPFRVSGFPKNRVPGWLGRAGLGADEPFVRLECKVSVGERQLVWLGGMGTTWCPARYSTVAGESVAGFAAEGRIDAIGSGTRRAERRL